MLIAKSWQRLKKKRCIFINDLKAKYKELLLRVKNDDYYKNTPEQKGKVNTYVCRDCFEEKLFFYEDTGCTPFSMKCPSCGGFNMISDDLRQGNENDLADYVWYRPELKEFLQLKPYQHEHILNGGLIRKEVPF